jgi:hypothetical protein
MNFFSSNNAFRQGWRSDPRDASVVSRRRFLQMSGGGFGALALSHLLAGESRGAVLSNGAGGAGGLHFPAKAKRIIQLFMNGGVSQMDTFDYKPELARRHGEMAGPKEKPEGQTGMPGAVMKSPFEFKQYGQSGRWVSSVFPHQAKHVDRMAFLMAMTGPTSVHGPGSYIMNTGFQLPGFPSLGAWLSYGLGSENENLPAYVVLPDARGLPYNQRGNFSSGFLPASHQGTVIRAGAAAAVPDLFPGSAWAKAGGDVSSRGLGILEKLNRAHAAEHPGDSRLEARIDSYELAARMQLSAPEAFDLTKETDVTRKGYGLDQPATEDFGRRCLLARRLVERGVRFVQVWSGPQGAANNWDNHGSIIGELPPIALGMDQPAAALLEDLDSRGLLEDTLVIWTTEFGRTPFAQGNGGRDHNGGSYVTWMAGAGVKPGVAYGESDSLGFKAEVNRTQCYDLHATILHLMGIDHEKLTFRHAGVDRRLTDVHGHVIHDILA